VGISGAADSSKTNAGRIAVRFEVGLAQYIRVVSGRAVRVGGCEGGGSGDVRRQRAALHNLMRVEAP
jgi:hypothetical protein